MATRGIEGATNWPLTFPTIPLALLSPNVYGNFGQAGRMCTFVSRSLLFSTPKTRSPSQPPFSYPTLIDLAPAIRASPIVGQLMAPSRVVRGCNLRGRTAKSKPCIQKLIVTACSDCSYRSVRSDASHFDYFAFVGTVAMFIFAESPSRTIMADGT